MALLHNSIFRGYNSIYQQAPNVKDSDKADFIGYALTWHKFVKSHHDDEEVSLFTKVEEVLGDKTIWDETHKEHGMWREITGLLAITAITFHADKPVRFVPQRLSSRVWPNSKNTFRH